MQTGEPSGARGAQKDDQEPAYEGELGRTRLESVHVPLPGGFTRTIQVYNVVNVATDPQLREAALGGALHRFETGEELAVPFVYHDPNARKLCLVVPESLRHRELKLRAELMGELAGDTEAAVPSYVREAMSVVGASALAAYLSAPPGSAVRHRMDALEGKSSELDVRGDGLDQREERLKARAEQVTRREDELRTFAERVEANQADLAMRERELEARFEEVSQQAASISGAVETVRADDVVELVDDEVEALDDLEPLKTSPGLTNRATTEMDAHMDLSDAVVEIVDDAPLEAVELEDVEELVEDVEELEELEPIDTGLSLRSSATQEGTDVRQTVDSLADIVTPSVLPPPGFLDRGQGAPAHAISEAGSVRIFVRLLPDQEHLFEIGEPSLLAQLVVVEECPVVLLSLIDRTGGKETVLRAAINPRSADDREVLENLRREFKARVVLFSKSGEYLRAREVEGPREVNVARILDRVSKLRAAAAVDVTTAIDRILSAPPPVSADDHPFQSTAPPKPKNAAESHTQLAQLAAWSAHEKMDHALLVLSIPRDIVDGTMRTALTHALEIGLPLPGRLPDRAVSLGVVSDHATLVTKQIEAFQKTAARPVRGGLTKEQVADAWEALLAAAAENEVAIDAETHDIAHKAIREVRGGPQSAVTIDLSKLPEMGVPELLLLLDHPRYRKEAAIELCERKEVEHAETLCKAARKMPRAEVVRVVPKLLSLGDAAGDALIDGLTARKTFVRQSFALSLGHLKLRRAVVPLVHLLASEESDVWREVARVVGSFGTASLRNVQRQLKDPKGKQERYILALAHLTHHGCLKQIERLTEDDKPAIATMASEALALREKAESVEHQVLGKAAPDMDDPVVKFSRRFYEELAGKAPEGDLD